MVRWKSLSDSWAEFKGQWPEHLLKLTHAYNSTRSAVTGYLPYILMLGQWLRYDPDKGIEAKMEI